MNNNDDMIDDYFNLQLHPDKHGKLVRPAAISEDEPNSIKIAKVYQKGAIHGAEIERERIIELLDKNLGNMNLDDLIKLIREENNG
jgi:predicted XRE-type DNA-binding protein